MQRRGRGDESLGITLSGVRALRHTSAEGGRTSGISGYRLTAQSIPYNAVQRNYCRTKSRMAMPSRTKDPRRETEAAMGWRDSVSGKAETCSVYFFSFFLSHATRSATCKMATRNKYIACKIQKWDDPYMFYTNVHYRTHCVPSFASWQKEVIRLRSA